MILKGNIRLRAIVQSIAVLFLTHVVSAQCPEVYDFYGTVTDEPYWYSCSGNDYTLNVQTPDSWGAYTIDWGDGTPDDSGASWTYPDFIQHAYVSAVDTFVVVITETATGCMVTGVLVMEEATSASIQIPVGGLTQSCAPQVMEFINSATNVSETTIFTWDFGDGSPQLVFDYTNWQQTIAHLYDVGTVDCETEVTLWAANYCNTVQGGPSQATFNPIRIWDLDDPSISASATLLCYPDTVVTFMNTTELNCYFQGNIYQRYEYWNFGDYWNLGYDSIVDWTPWPPTFPHTIAFPGIGTYSIEMADSNFCGIAPTSITIQIVPPPIAQIDISDDTVCVGTPVTFYQQSTGGMNVYKWNFGNGMGWIPTGGGNITFVYGTPGTYTVQAMVGVTGASNSCSDTTSVQVVVLPNPVVSIIPDQTMGCDNLDVNFTQVASDAVQWNWTFDVSPGSYSGNSPPTISYDSPGTYNVTLAVLGQNGCPGSDTEVIQLYQSPVADFAMNNLCEGDSAQFIDESAGSVNDPIITWNWDFDDGEFSSNQSPMHLYNATGTFDVTLEVTTVHCNDEVTLSMSVDEAPAPQIGQDVLNGCGPVTVQFSNTTTNAISYTWNFGDGQNSTAAEPLHTYFNPTTQDTTYVITMTADNEYGCGGTDTLFVTVFPSAQAGFNDNSTPPGCSPFEANFFNTSTGASSYLWDMGDGTTTTTENPVYTFNNTSGFIDTYDVTLYAYASNGCNDTVMHIITVFPLADLDFTIWPDSGCAPLTVTMPYISGALEYLWDFGDGTTSTFAIPTHQYQNATYDPILYTVTLVATSPFGCVDTASSSVLVNPSPLAQFNADVTAGCAPLTATFQNLSIQSDYFEWNYGDGTTSTTSSVTHTHTYYNTTNSVQNFQVMLTAHSDDGCSHQFVIPVQAYPEVVASVNEPSPQCAPASVYFDNTSVNGSGYLWDFGNGLQSTEENPTGYFVNNTADPIIFNVQLQTTSSFGCVDEISFPVVINPTPVADFEMSETSLCEPAPIIFSNTSIYADSYNWNYGDGQTSANSDSIHVHVFQDPMDDLMDYNIVLVASTNEGCTSSTTAIFSLYPQVIAAFAVDTIGCSPHAAMFMNQSIDANSYEWSFGDGQFSAANNPVNIYTTNSTSDTTYTAELVAENQFGCTDTADANIHVLHTPLAVAQIDNLFDCYPMTAVLANYSIGADYFQWVYGTGDVSSNSNTLHEYTYFNFSPSLITYNITLNVYTNNGCTSSDQLTVDVYPDLNADFEVDNEGCTPLTLTLDNNSDGAFSYLWNFGDGDFSNEYEPTHTFFNWGISDTTYTITLIIQNAFGCTDTADASITVFPVPNAQFTASPFVQTWPAATITIDNMTTGGTLTYDWDMDDGTDLFVEEPGDYTYATWGEYNIELFVSNGSCNDSYMQTVEILAPAPVANFEGPAQGCGPLNVQFNNLSEYAVSSFWQFGDGGTANSTNPVYTYWQPGTYTVSLTVYGYDGTSDQMVQQNIIEVYPSAIAAFTVTPSEVNVPGQPVYYLNLSQQADIYEWQFGDGGTSTVENPIYLYQDAGTYTVTLIANNEYNCPDTMVIADAVHAIAVGQLDFPNAFTPNQQDASGGSYDAMGYDNDVFFPLHKGVTEFEMFIFNKWGELLFETKDIWRGWDGYYRSELCKQDVYVWKARARFVDGQEVVKSGDVTLLVR